MNPTLNCAKCGGAMEEGFLVDNVGEFGAQVQSRWLEGKPEHSRWAGLKTRGRQELNVITYRCAACGFLESYASDKGEAPEGEAPEGEAPEGEAPEGEAPG